MLVSCFECCPWLVTAVAVWTMQAMALLGSKEVGTVGVVWCSVTGEGSQHSVSAWCPIDPVPNQHRGASTALSPTGTMLPHTGQSAALVLCLDPACSVLIWRLCPCLHNSHVINTTLKIRRPGSCVWPWACFSHHNSSVLHCLSLSTLTQIWKSLGRNIK